MYKCSVAETLIMLANYCVMLQIYDRRFLFSFYQQFNFKYRGFHEKGTRSYLCALGIDRYNYLFGVKLLLYNRLKDFFCSSYSQYSMKKNIAKTSKTTYKNAASAK